jgi:hypothetical protein
MKLVVVSHKECWSPAPGASQYVTDGGFPVQIKALAELFDSTSVVVPCVRRAQTSGVTPLDMSLELIPLQPLLGKGLSRKLSLPTWFVRNGRTIWDAIARADAVHAPIPGDVGTIGMVFALMQRKPLFVRHCGNWLAPRTVAEWFWKLTMELFAGGKNVMLATGGSSNPPSRRNQNIQWIFSTSLKKDRLLRSRSQPFPEAGALRLITVSRQEPGKGTDIVIRALPKILTAYSKAILEVVGSGSMLAEYRSLVEKLGLTDRVRFHGKVPQSEISGYLNQAHVFCYPTSASEGFPKVVLEALAAGLPVITTQVSVLPELVKNCGVVIELATPELLANAVIEVVSNRPAYEEMSSTACSRAAQFTLEAWRDTIKGILVGSWGEAEFLPPVITDNAERV